MAYHKEDNVCIICSTRSFIFFLSSNKRRNHANEQYDKLVEGATSKFQPDKGFAGAEGGGGHVSSGAARTAPVQFEKEQK
jgi:SNW domain-containing protein 1